ncbi:MAG: DUF922 domain-containing protein [Myxococcota bacterium]
MIEHVHEDRRADFPVRGRSRRAILRSIHEVTRLANIGGERYRGRVLGVTNSHLDIDVVPAKEFGGCVLRRVTVETGAVVFVPEWTGPGRLPVHLARWWEGQRELIDAHEQGHRDITFTIGDELVAQIASVSAPADDCEELHDRIDVLWSIALEKHGWLQAEYDRQNPGLPF